MAFNLDKAIAGMSFGFPSSERIDETVGILLSYPATPEGHALLSVYTFELQMSWPRLYIEALLLLQRNAFVEEAAKTDSIRTLKKRKYDKNYREANNVKKVIDGSRDQMLGFDHKGRVRLVGIVQRRANDVLWSAVQLRPEVAAGSTAASSSMQFENSLAAELRPEVAASTTASLPMKIEDSVAGEIHPEVAAASTAASSSVQMDEESICYEVRPEVAAASTDASLVINDDDSSSD
jgi:hypothetical protein